MANAADLKSAGRFSLVGSIPTRSICTVTTYLVPHPTTRIAFGADCPPVVRFASISTAFGKSRSFTIA